MGYIYLVSEYGLFICQLFVGNSTKTNASRFMVDDLPSLPDVGKNTVHPIPCMSLEALSEALLAHPYVHRIPQLRLRTVRICYC